VRGRLVSLEVREHVSESGGVVLPELAEDKRPSLEGALRALVIRLIEALA
jgi:hypothetical protein